MIKIKTERNINPAIMSLVVVGYIFGFANSEATNTIKPPTAIKAVANIASDMYSLYSFFM